ncbi:hypothetical protein FACS189455_4130 [Bacteroidia bacterium]|nr:hypothetical protein FACS189455_4130 [Bacteroidia bacterium]
MCIFCLAGCGQDEKLGLDATDNVAPTPPTVVSIENVNGGAIITFKAPKDEDLLCVVASYTINGVERTTKVSPYVDKLKVEGFMEGEFQVNLTSVDKSKNESQPVPVKINPLIPPVELIFESLNVLDSFGGVKLFWENPMKDNVIVEVSRKDGDEWISVENFYTNAPVGQGSIRGFDPEPITFRFRIRDRWDNYSEYRVTDNLPLEEKQLDKSKFKMVTILPGDSPSHSSLVISNIWDGNTTGSNNCYHGSGSSSNYGEMNRTITFDMGQKAKISRFKLWQRLSGDSWTFNHNNIKHYVIYGCNELTAEMYTGGTLHPDPDWAAKDVILPTFEGWTEVLDVWCLKPSGLPTGQLSNEDREAANNGDEHEIPIEVPSFRYIRILFLENWSGGNIAQIGEMTFWGQIVE